MLQQQWLCIFKSIRNAIAKRFIYIECFNDAKWTIATDELVSQVQNSHCYFRMAALLILL